MEVSGSAFIPPPPLGRQDGERTTSGCPESDEIGNLIEEVVNLSWPINLEVDTDDVQELLNSHIQELIEAYRNA
ncbi:hypothetical protein TNCV_4132251 [Trichonephila clavipes]|nr:hypothetical protein TNCV_4132251 [Trichonephila clavipes]